MAAAVPVTGADCGSVCPVSPPPNQPVSRRKKPYPWSDMLNRRVVFKCCWRTWIEYIAAAEGSSKSHMSKEDFSKTLDELASTRIRDSRDLEAFWSAFCSSSGVIDDGVECNLRFFREGVRPTWEGSGAHGKFTYSTKKRYTKVKLFALIRTAVLEVLAQSEHVCGVVLSCRAQKDFISVWNMSADSTVQQSILRELMTVLDITPSTDCIHYLAFGDLLPGDMRQRIAGRTLHASAHRYHGNKKDADDDQVVHPHASIAPGNPSAACIGSEFGSSVSVIESLHTSGDSHLPTRAENPPIQVPCMLPASVIVLPVCAAVIWWLWFMWLHFFA